MNRKLLAELVLRAAPAVSKLAKTSEANALAQMTEAVVIEAVKECIEIIERATTWSYPRSQAIQHIKDIEERFEL